MVNGILYFSANDGIHGFSLWKTDGTETGTLVVEATKGLQPIYLTAVNGSIFFVARNASQRTDTQALLSLWKTDGTNSGTMELKVFGQGSFKPLPQNLTQAGGLLFFSIDDQDLGVELWKSDGTESGTHPVKDIHPDKGSFPFNLTDVNGILFFSASEGTSKSLWKSDGTETGTVMIKDFSSLGSVLTFSLKKLNGTLYFSIRNSTLNDTKTSLWKSDGTELGTEMVFEIISVDGHFFMISLEVLDGILYFLGGDDNSGPELWKSDGTEKGTVLVKEIIEGKFTPFIPHFPAFFPYNNIIFFQAHDGIHGYEIWKSDGTEEGTVMVKDIYPGPRGSQRGPRLITIN